MWWWFHECNSPRRSERRPSSRRPFAANHLQRAGSRYINYGWRVIIGPEEYVDLETPYGPMRTYVLSPAAAGRYPGLVLFSEIFQVTGPVRRTAAFLAGHGYIVAVPEIFHELEEDPGVVLAYDTAGADRGNSHKITKELASYERTPVPSWTFSPTILRALASSGRSGSVSAVIFPSVRPSIPVSAQRPVSTPPISTSAGSARV